MSNRCSQTVTLYGDTDKIAEVLNYIKGHKDYEWDEGANFATPVFPNSACHIPDDKTICLETSWYTPLNELKTLSNKFRDVGFISGSFTDGQGEEEEAYIIEGRIVYHQYLDVQAPEYWEKVTGNKMKSTNYF
jgi:hypothetical protein